MSVTKNTINTNINTATLGSVSSSSPTDPLTDSEQVQVLLAGSQEIINMITSLGQADQRAFLNGAFSQLYYHIDNVNPNHVTVPRHVIK